MGVDELVGLRRGGGSEKRVSDEHRTSLTVVLHGGKHQSQVIYSLPWPGPSFFSPLLCVFVNTEHKTGYWPDHCSPHLHCKAIPPLPPCLSLFKFTTQMHGSSSRSISQSHFPISLPHLSLFFFFACSFSSVSVFVLPLPVC